MAFTHKSKEKWKASKSVKGYAMDPLYTFPPNIALITLQELDLGNVLLRLALFTYPLELVQTKLLLVLKFFFYYK
ncbi:putative alpha-mannosidase [Cardamine amara subsp. amara]|uniref:Alpha-mannosidase n=1 Tax=Cardamine amara subsp. amara TaxID=228776 RepID=A0ABD0ZNU7_CARAN